MAKLVSKVYGDALFEAALEDNRLSGLSDEVTAVKEIIAANDDLSKLMDHPQIDKEEKVRIIEEIFGGRVSAELVGLMRMIIEKNHYKELTLVFDYFLDRVKEYQNIGTAYITSAFELSKEQKLAVEKRLLDTTKYVKFEMHFEVDTALIGGMKIRIGDLEIVGLKEEKKQTVATGLEMFRKTLDQAEAGDNIGALLRGIERNEIERGQVLSKPGTIHPHTKFKGQVYVLTKEEGGRHTPFFNGYRPQFYFRTTDVTGVAELPEGTEMVMPGDNITMDVELITPIAIEKGLRFAIREGGRTVGAGVVTEIEE